ncbi:MAG: hypothetical protein ACE5EZ_04830 [Thermodesulfobacteriota bacterium]
MKAKNKRGLFSTKQLHLSIAVIVVVALIGGVVLQSATKWAVSFYSLPPLFHGLILIFGYLSLILLLSAVFVYKLVGPFRRLEYEMKCISSGELTRRLSVRDGDDLHVRRFVMNVNDLVGKCEEMSREYNKLNNIVDTKLVEINEDLSNEKRDFSVVGKEIKMLQEEIHVLREKW